MISASPNELRAQSESKILELGCVRTRASKEAVVRVGSVARGPLASNVLHLLTYKKKYVELS